MRKSAYIIFFIAMLLPIGAWAWGGSGTSSSPYTISTAADLQKFANIVNGTNNETRNVAACAKLTADIDLNNAAWTAMGTDASGRRYTGTFDGQGHTISGLSISGTGYNQGLFGIIDGATIKNFTLSGTINASNDGVGSVVGRANGASQILDVKSSVNVNISGTRSKIGGIVGYLTGSSAVSGCTYTGTLDAGNTYDCIGGIVGFAEGGSFTGSITYCFSNCTFKTTSTNANLYVGGILGYLNDDPAKKPTIQYNFSDSKYKNGSNADISGTYINGIVGRIRNDATNVKDNHFVSTSKITTACNDDSKATISSTNSGITISVTAGANGTVSHSYVNPTSTTATKLHVDATPNDGYHFANWNVSGAKAHDVELTANVTRIATFGAHTYGDWITDKAATCTATGTKHHVCTFAGCDAKEDGTIPATGHGQTNGYTPTYTWSNDINAHTCSFSLKCKDCSANVVTNKSLTGTQTAHTDATCTREGSTTYRVTGSYNVSGSKQYSDNNSKTYTIAVLGHDFTSQTATDTYRKSAATCTADAVYYYKCSRCTTKGTSTWTNTGTSTGHGHTKGYTPTYTWSDDIDVHTCSFTLKCLDCNAYVVSNSSLTGTQTAHTDPTCTATGSTTYQVTGSYSNTKSVAYNENNSKTYTIDALGHDMTAHARVDATCTETGMDAYWTCSRCEGKLFKDENGTEEWDGMPVLEALGHDISNNQCSRCDLKAKAVFANNTLTFYFDDIEHDGTTYSLNTGSSDPGWLEKRMDIYTVVFDSSFGSARPTTCYKWFYNSQWLRKITGLEYLNTEEVTNMNSMFYSCSFLLSLDLSGFNTSKVSDMAFMFNSCSSLKSLDLSSFNTSITTRTNVMFAYCNTLQSLTIGNFDMSLVTYSGDMFFNCYNLKTLTLKSIPFLKEGTFDTWFTGDGKTVNLVLDENSVIYKGPNYLPTITNCNHYNQTTPVHVDPTCSEDGYDGKTCSYCHTDFDKTTNGSALGHDMTEHALIPATCTETGMDAYWTCSRCLDKLFKDNNGAAEWDGMPVLAALGHDMTAHAHVDATCTTSGNEAYWTCSRCDDKFFKDNNGAAEWDGMPVLAALGHNMTAHAHVDATCTTDGNEAYWTCSRCLDKLFKDAEGNALWDAMPVIAAVGHHYDADGICEVCDDAPVMDWLTIEDGTAYTARASREVNYLTYARNFYGPNWTTWYVPFDMELTDEIYDQMDFSRINNVHQYDDDEDGIADRTIIESFRQKAGVTLKANYPYLVRAKNFIGDRMSFYLNFQDVTVAAAAENSIVCRSIDYCYTFTGTYKDMGDSGYENYSLFDDVDDNWYHFTKLEPMRHYMTITSRDGGSAPQQADVKLQIIGDEDADGIVSIYSKEQQSNATYDLMGRKINSNTKQPGLRIVNGKVVFVK